MFPVYRIESGEDVDMLFEKHNMGGRAIVGRHYPFYIRVGNFNSDGWARLSRDTDEAVINFYKDKRIPIELLSLKPTRTINLDKVL